MNILTSTWDSCLYFKWGGLNSAYRLHNDFMVLLLPKNNINNYFIMQLNKINNYWGIQFQIVKNNIDGLCLNIAVVNFFSFLVVILLFLPASMVINLSTHQNGIWWKENKKLTSKLISQNYTTLDIHLKCPTPIDDKSRASTLSHILIWKNNILFLICYLVWCMFMMQLTLLLTIFLGFRYVKVN